MEEIGMQNVLILGAGLVARPLVRYLLDQPGLKVTVASRTVAKAEALIEGHPRGVAEALLVDDEAHLDALVAGCDLAISMVPYTYHVVVAKHCIKHKKHMVTTSYVSDAMAALDGEAKAAGITILNELGLDPGIDHMSAMRIIDGVHSRGGQIVSFESCCGGLPAPEANDNPFGYKFSWSPRGVVMAGRNAAKYLKDGKVVEIPGEALFDHYWTRKVDTLGELEVYPNRNSLPYINTYGIQETKTMFRGTFRNLGWCKTMKKIVELGMLDDKVRKVKGMTFADLTRQLVGAAPGKNLRAAAAEFLKLPVDSDVMDRLEWLGLFSSDPLPMEEGSNLDILAARMLQKMAYRPNERDMIVLVHDFVADFPKEKRREKITSSLIDFGIPGGDSSMSRTVGLPAAIGARYILEGKITRKGVIIPVWPEIYVPILNELEKLGIKCKESTEVLRPA
ncbi:MAG: saccharopine dehydrogenase NADP-binding domain-containing protein [candidate division KSB1 bacterium]|nr:saccharopine dehydrogenase NADP-binding domain-containing protein [candidate division KSB1 bacterium]